MSTKAALKRTSSTAMAFLKSMIVSHITVSGKKDIKMDKENSGNSQLLTINRIIVPTTEINSKLEKYYENYKGGFKKSRFEGHGIYHFADGAVYEGSWESNLRRGDGKLKLPSKK